MTSCKNLQAAPEHGLRTGSSATTSNGGISPFCFGTIFCSSEQGYQRLSVLEWTAGRQQCSGYPLRTIDGTGAAWIRPHFGGPGPSASVFPGRGSWSREGRLQDAHEIGEGLHALTFITARDKLGVRDVNEARWPPACVSVAVSRRL